MSEAPKPPPPPPPPSPPSPGPSTSSGAGGGGIDNNVAGLLAYFVLPAIIWLLIEPYSRNNFVRFHAIQGIALAVVSIGGSMVLGMIPILGWIMLIFWPFVIFIAAVIAMVKAFQNEKWQLPIIGKFAEEQAAKM